MAQSWGTKAPTAIVERVWTVPVGPDDALSSVTVVAVNVTADSNRIDGNDAYVTLSGGTAGNSATVTITATTADGLIHVETFYFDIVASTAQLGTTVRDVCLFALRKVAGIGDEPDADELSDAVERLGDMIALWSAQGAAMGIDLPLAEADTLGVSDAHIFALKYNLMVALSDLYGFELSPFSVDYARRGLAQIKNDLVPDNRGRAVYF